MKPNITPIGLVVVILIICILALIAFPCLRDASRGEEASWSPKVLATFVWDVSTVAEGGGWRANAVRPYEISSKNFLTVARSCPAILKVFLIRPGIFFESTKITTSASTNNISDSPIPLFIVSALPKTLLECLTRTVPEAAAPRVFATGRRAGSVSPRL